MAENRAGPDSVEKEGGETAGVREWRQSLVITVEARWFKKVHARQFVKKNKVEILPNQSPDKKQRTMKMRDQKSVKPTERSRGAPHFPPAFCLTSKYFNDFRQCHMISISRTVL